jgi:hypothetical protein
MPLAVRIHPGVTMTKEIYDKWGKKIGHIYGPPKSEPPVRSSELILRLLSLIDIRRKSAQRELKDAIENKQWSKVPGWDGIDIGLMMAEKTIKEEMQQNDGTQRRLPPPLSNDNTKNENGGSRSLE